MNVIIFFLLSILNLLIFIYLEKITKFINIYDLPNRKLKKHKKKTPVLGGIIFFFNLLLILFLQFIYQNDFLFVELNLINVREKISILFLVFSFFIIGLYDDKYKISPNHKIFYSLIILVISLLLNDGVIVERISLSFYNKKIFLNNFSIVFTIFCFLILINALNFYDGINGQSCLFFLIIFLYLFAKSGYDQFYLFLALVIFFILLLNIKNKLFLGDSGIYLIASLISVCLIYEYNLKKNISFSDEIFLLLILPGIDLLRLTITRAYKGKNVLYGDRNHIHHLLSNRVSNEITNLILLILSLAPIILFTFVKINFYFSVLPTLIMYLYIILKFK